MEITLFTYGDSNDVSLWSNYPYFIAKGIEDNGCILNRVDLKKKQYMIEILFNDTFRRIVKLFRRDTTYAYKRTWLHHIVTNYLLKKAIKSYPNTDLFISLSFSL